MENNYQRRYRTIDPLRQRAYRTIDLLHDGGTIGDSLSVRESDEASEASEDAKDSEDVEGSEGNDQQETIGGIDPSHCSGTTDDSLSIQESDEDGHSSDIVIVIEEHSPPKTMRPQHVRLSHFSVKEYLVSSRIKTSSAARFSIRESNANLQIALSCLLYHLHISEDESHLNTPSSLLETFPLWRYATRYWPEHIESMPIEDWP